jgi:hypothetical protein
MAYNEGGDLPAAGLGRRGSPQIAALTEGDFVSIVRVGLAETKNFAEGYDAIFGKKKSSDSKKPKAVAKAAEKKKKKPTKKK